MATIKHKIAFKEVLKGTTLTKAMEKANYAPSTVKTTGKLTRTKGWKELMEKELPDGLLAERHRELLNKREFHKIKVNGEEESEFIDTPETQAVSKALDMAYKIKSRYPKENETNVNVAVLQVTGMKIVKDGDRILNEKRETD